ncbi:hypothetical protein GcM3_102001 [Golovinomyces cichoracearum]|uniref:Uncharacterized protein n=1 Tax=Golovinomyces cichoracearum TaxID=62708 RepID=A0A420IA80_9PEZI|nr:hypothetical protein GcM3_102001 [Golovinomyces cichoracearum]
MSLSIYNSSSPDIPNENMYDPASTTFETIADDTQQALGNSETLEFDIENLTPDNSPATDPIES